MSRATRDGAGRPFWTSSGGAATLGGRTESDAVGLLDTGLAWEAWTERALVAFANRLPVVRVRGRWQPASGGLVVALRPALVTRSASWVGWDGGTGAPPGVLPGLRAVLQPVTLPRSEAEGYYAGFSNRTLWPLFHDLVRQPVLDWSWWDAYRRANERFAQAAAELVASVVRPPLLWVHDYHLLLLPELLRQAYPGCPIAFFLHVPFPPPELFARLPWRAELLRGLLGADLVAFQTDGDRGNFVRAASSLLPEVDADGDSVVLGNGRRVRAAAHPISIDAGALAREATAPAVEQELALLRGRFCGRTVLLGVDRLDYTKGILERLQAIALLLERRADLRRRLVFVQIAVPSREDVPEYGALRRRVEKLVARINSRFTEPGCEPPVHYFFRSVSRSRLLAHYRLADVALVTPLRDGMNLVAKEFVVCQAAGGGRGALVLSEFAGAARELVDAVPCNPFDVPGLADAVERALELGEEARRSTLARMAASVHAHDVFRWAEEHLGVAELAADVGLPAGLVALKSRGARGSSGSGLRSPRPSP